MHHSTTINQDNSPLLRLPAELRNRIYELAFSNTKIVIVPRDKYHTQPYPYSRQYLGSFALLHTSRQLRLEATTACYTLTAIILGPAREITLQVNNILLTFGAENCRLIRHIETNWHAVIQTYLQLKQARYRSQSSAGGRTLAGAILPALKSVEVAHCRIVVDVNWKEIYEHTYRDTVRELFEKPNLVVYFIQNVRTTEMGSIVKRHTR